MWMNRFVMSRSRRCWCLTPLLVFPGNHKHSTTVGFKGSTNNTNRSLFTNTGNTFHSVVGAPSMYDIRKLISPGGKHQQRRS